jgi:enoyl-CoA hydratase/carnithine racemase
MTYAALLYETEGEVGILTYNRPNIVNAINRQMQRDFDARVLIVTGGGEKGFCSGLDMKAVATEFAPAGGATAESTFDGQIHFSVLMRLMRSCPQPIIAAVHGPAMGAGLSFAMSADIRLASEDAFFCAQAGNN